MKILIFGGTKFIGRHTVEVLLEHGYEVAVLNRGLTPDLLPKQVERIQADRTKPDQVIEALRGRGFDAVVDCIGFQPKELEQAVDIFKGAIKRYIYISSTSAYRPATRFPIDESFPVVRGSKWEYAQNKVLCEDVLIAAMRDYGFPAVWFRPCYVYGPYNSNPEWEMKFFARIEQGRKVLIPGDGSFIFHHVHARDIATAVAAATERPQAAGPYNIDGPYAVTANEYVDTVAKAMGRQIEIVHVPGPTDRRSAEVYFPFQPRPTQIYSTERARRDLGWEPRFDLLSGHRDAYRWYVESRFEKTHQYDFGKEDDVLASLGNGG